MDFKMIKNNPRGATYPVMAEMLIVMMVGSRFQRMRFDYIDESECFRWMIWLRLVFIGCRPLQRQPARCYGEPKDLEVVRAN